MQGHMIRFGGKGSGVGGGGECTGDSEADREGREKRADCQGGARCRQVADRQGLSGQGREAAMSGAIGAPPLVFNVTCCVNSVVFF